MKKTFLLCCFCFGYLMNSQSFETGVVLDSLSVVNSQNETFALYLPKNYKPEETWPILFIFSPSGNAKEGLEVFKSSAEIFNYILVCSNNSRNGPYDRNFAIAQRLFNHIFANFNIAKNRTYLAGFSGGSRLANSIAVLSGEIQGVIACGAGLASVPSYMPTAPDYYYVGICGNRDMNYKEMLDTSKYLNRLKFQNTLFTFDGGHRWPPNEQLLMAFELLEIEAYNKGVLQISKDKLKTSYIKNYMFTKKAFTNNNPLLAEEGYKHILKTFSRYYSLDSITKGLETLRKSKTYINAKNQRKKAFEKELLLSQKLISHFTNEFNNPEKINLKWWDKELEKIDKMAEKQNAEIKHMTERLLFKLFAMAYEKKHLESDITIEQKEFRKTILSKTRSRLFGKNKKNDG